MIFRNFEFFKHHEQGMKTMIIFYYSAGTTDCITDDHLELVIVLIFEYKTSRPDLVNEKKLKLFSDWYHLCN